MKKVSKSIILMMMIALIMTLTGCTKQETTQTAKVETNTMTAGEIIEKMKAQTSNIGKVVIYTEETDLNKLLGRPGQYTSKIGFEDVRLEQVNANNEFLTAEERNEPTGGSIEVFANEKDMESRKKYIESFASIPAFSQYLYSKGNILLRIDGKLTPSQAKEYEEIFNKIVK